MAIDTRGPGSIPGQDSGWVEPRTGKLLIFANAAAGTLARFRGEPPLEQYARQAGFEPEVIYTRSSGQLRRLLRERVVGRVDRVAVAGGDGTIHSAVQVLAGTGATLGILPQGTANNFATALRLPMDLPSAFRVIAEGEERAVDLGEVEGEYFTEAAGVGLFADLLSITGAHHNLGHVLQGLRVLLSMLVSMRARRLTLLIDGAPQVEEALSVSVANTFCLGYNLPIAPYARVTDEQLDVVIVGPLTRRELIPYYRAMRAQVHPELPKVQVVRAKEVQIRSRCPELVHVDDRVCRRTPATIRVAPGALKVMVDRL